MAKPATRAKGKTASADPTRDEPRQDVPEDPRDEAEEENVDYDEESEDEDPDVGNNNPPVIDNPNPVVAQGKNAMAVPNREAPVVFALCPGQVNPNRILNYEKASDVKLYKSATEPFNKDKPYDVDSAGLMQFMTEVRNRANEHGWTNPDYGLCVISITENNVTTKYDLTLQYGCVSTEQVIANDTAACVAGTRKAQNSMMLHKLLMNCLSSVGKNKVMTPEYQQKIWVNGQNSGNVLLKVITEIARPQTPASIQMLRNNITNMSDRMTEFGQDIVRSWKVDEESHARDMQER